MPAVPRCQCSVPPAKAVLAGAQAAGGNLKRPVWHRWYASVPATCTPPAAAARRATRVTADSGGRLRH